MFDRPSDKAWTALAASIIAWDVACGPGEMLSEASRRYRDGHPLLWQATVIYIAAHLCHVVPDRYDPLSRLAVALGR